MEGLIVENEELFSKEIIDQIIFDFLCFDIFEMGQKDYIRDENIRKIAQENSEKFIIPSDEDIQKLVDMITENIISKIPNDLLGYFIKTLWDQESIYAEMFFKSMDSELQILIIDEFNKEDESMLRAVWKYLEPDTQKRRIKELLKNAPNLAEKMMKLTGEEINKQLVEEVQEEGKISIRDIWGCLPQEVQSEFFEGIIKKDGVIQTDIWGNTKTRVQNENDDIYMDILDEQIKKSETLFDISFTWGLSNDQVQKKYLKSVLTRIACYEDGIRSILDFTRVPLTEECIQDILKEERRAIVN